MPSEFIMSKLKSAIALATILAITFYLYLPTRNFNFVYDDQIAIVQNSSITIGELSFQNIGQIFRSSYKPGKLYRPVTSLSYLLNVAIFGMSPGYFHLVNLIIHLLCVCLCYRLLARIFGGVLFAALGAFLFAIHPVNVESVASIVGRAELLVFFWGISAIFLFEKAVLSKYRGKYILYLFGTIVCLFFALLSKESALTILLLLPLYLFCREFDGWCSTRFSMGYLLLIVSALGALLARYQVLGADFLIQTDPNLYTAANPLTHVSFISRLYPALQVLGHYLILILWPIRLCADYSRAEGDFWSLVFSTTGFLYFCALLGLLALLWLRHKSRKHLFLLWFFIAFSLTANILTPIGTIMGERLVYLPLVGVLGWVLAYLDSCSRQNSRFFAIALIIYGTVLYQYTSARISVWQNEEVFFRVTALEAPLSPKAQFHQGLSLYSRGEFIESRPFFYAAHQIMPSNIESMLYLADIALRNGVNKEALFWSKQILEINSSEPIANAIFNSLSQADDSMD